MYDLIKQHNRPNRNKDAKRQRLDGDQRAQRQLKVGRKQTLNRVREQEAMQY